MPRGDLNLLGILERFIGDRIERKRLRGFDYHGTAAVAAPGVPPAKRDWRKRTREMEYKKVAKKAPRKPAAAPRPPAAKKTAKRAKPGRSDGQGPRPPRG